jgi:hypothetical protein
MTTRGAKVILTVIMASFTVVVKGDGEPDNSTVSSKFPPPSPPPKEVPKENAAPKEVKPPEPKLKLKLRSVVSFTSNDGICCVYDEQAKRNITLKFGVQDETSGLVAESFDQESGKLTLKKGNAKVVVELEKQGKQVTSNASKEDIYTAPTYGGGYGNSYDYGSYSGGYGGGSYDYGSSYGNGYDYGSYGSYGSSYDYGGYDSYGGGW